MDKSYLAYCENTSENTYDFEMISWHKYLVYYSIEHEEKTIIDEFHEEYGTLADISWFKVNYE